MARSKNSALLAIGTCAAAAIFEGLDIQSMGVAAPRIASVFHIGPAAMGLALSASTMGLAIGAWLGGWLSDRIGRRTVLAAAMLALGIFSFATSQAEGFASLLAMRVLAGFGLGGVFPSLIAITSEVAPSRLRATALGAVYCGMPLGGMLAAWLMSVARPDDWAIVFRVGGVGPLVLVPLILAFVPRYRPDTVAAPAARHSIAVEPNRYAQLFGARARVTVLLWLAYFFTLFAVYLLLNWLPSLMIAKGLTQEAAAHSAIWLNLGAAIGGILLGWLVDRGRLPLILLLTYAGMVLALFLLVFAAGPALQWAAFVTGFFVIGGQLVLYALAPVLYPLAIRGTGVGAAVAAGRLGSVLGPICAGFVVAQGWDAHAVPAIAIPGIVLALLAALLLVTRSMPETAPAVAERFDDWSF